MEKDEDVIVDENVEQEEVKSTIEEVTTPSSESNSAPLKVEKSVDFKKIERQRKRKIKQYKKDAKKNGVKIERFDPDINVGLTSSQIEQRIVEGLENKTDVKTGRSIPQIIFSNIFTFFNILIFIIAGCLIAVGAFTDLVFLLIVSCNILVSIIQEIKAKKMIDKLSLMASPTAIVVRDGQEHEISVDEVVLDDIVILESGKEISSDSILVEGSVEVNESMLTGESDAILKKPGDMLYSGSYVVSGKCVSKVVFVGKDNYVEKLSSQAKQYKKPKSDLLFSLNLIIKVMSVPVVVLGLILFFRMFFNDNINLTTTVRKTAGAMIGMIPSGLFLMSTIALMIGVIRLGQKNVLVQELYCIEMLARVNCICLDKTGTITDGTMVVKNVIDYNQVGGLATKNIVSAMLNALNDNNLTSQALKDKFGLGKRIKDIGSIPFSSQRKFQAVTFDKYGTFILGAPEFVLKDDFVKYQKDVDKYAGMGYRVLCLAHQDGIIIDNQLPTNSKTVISMILIEDNIRPDAINTIRYFRESSVQVKVISGDNPITVSKISQRAGIENAEEYVSLDGMSDEDVIKAAVKYTVFGRVSPNQKKLIIQTLKDAGKTVAMTGDGVNDILALREADCSIAVASGSEAACNCSHLVLLDSNFDSMPSVVAEGRRVINNVAKVSSLFLTKTIFSLFLAIEALIIGSYPISTNQLILIETLAIGLPSLFLIWEPNNELVKGRFLYNVLKESLPGAFTILIISAIVFVLTKYLYLDQMSLTTIIVIAATHTCMMVLLKACKPYNTMRRWLCVVCYSLFLFFAFVMPQFLEFRPFISLTEYYSKNVITETVNSYPKIRNSENDYYVVNGKVIDLAVDKSNQNYTLVATTSDDPDDNALYYAIDGVRIDFKVELPDLSYDNKGNIFFGGYQIENFKYSDSFDESLTVDQLGYVYSNNIPVKIRLTRSDAAYNYAIKYGTTTAKDAIKQLNILPTVTISNGEYIINGSRSEEYKYEVNKTMSSIISQNEVTIRQKDGKYVLYVDDNEVLGSPRNTDGEKKPYVVELPKVSIAFAEDIRNSKMYIDALNTGHSIFEIYGDKKEVDIDDVTYDTYTITTKTADDTIDIVCRIEQGTNIRQYLVSNSATPDEPVDFKFENLGKNAFKLFFDENNTSIDVNSKNKTLILTGAVGKSNYYLKHDDLIEVNCSLNNSRVGPTIETTKEGMCIIDGYYTNYEYNKSTDLILQKNKDDYLVINGTTTDYKLTDITIENGGYVRELPIASKIFLIMLCAIAAPLMKVIQNCIPWVIKQVNGVKKFLIKERK